MSMVMGFHETTYLREMNALLSSAKHAFLEKYPNLEIYTISIWTDPDAAISSISFDTFAHSEMKVAEQNLWARRYYDRMMSEGDQEQAKLFLPSSGRQCNPAGFFLSQFETIKNSSFEPNWEEKSDGQCWDELEPALRKIGEAASRLFRDIPLHSDAELGVNGRSDWYSETWPLR